MTENIVTKVCRKCLEDRPLQKYRGNGKAKICQSCEKKSRCEHPRRPLTDYERDKRLRHNYGITAIEYKAMLEQQKGLCAICKDPLGQARRICVDHDHRTKKVRGLLCSNCNFMLGHSRDDVTILSSGITYLQAHQ